MLKTVTYNRKLPTEFTIEYDSLAPCVGCNLPVVEASMGGTSLCPWCDTGYDRQGKPILWKYRVSTDEERAAGKAEAVFDNAHKASEEEYARARKELEDAESATIQVP